MRVSILLDAAAATSMEPMDLIMKAGPIVKGVMILLMLLSVASWAIIFIKIISIRSARSATRDFIKQFFSSPVWNAERFDELYTYAGKKESSPTAGSFRAGYEELSRLSDGVAIDAEEKVESVERAAERSQTQYFTALESWLPVLATTGSAAPFIGLFGTVWGIMNSFIAIHGEKNASLDVVAPGIAEALIATAIGLVAAIPAVVAYNFLIRSIQVLEADTSSFHNDFLNIIRRKFV